MPEVSAYPCWSDPLGSRHNIMLYTPEERQVLEDIAHIDVIGLLFSMFGSATRPLIVQGAARSPGEIFPLLADPGNGRRPYPSRFAARRNGVIRGEWEYAKGQLIPVEQTQGLVRLLASGAIRPVDMTAPCFVHARAQGGSVPTQRRFISAETLAAYTQAFDTGDASMFSAGHRTPSGPLQALRAPPRDCIVRRGTHRVLHHLPGWPPARRSSTGQEG